MSKEEIIGKHFNLDLSSSSPVEIVVRDITKDKVIVEYLKSTPGRIEEFTISDFEYFAMVKIESSQSKYKPPGISTRTEMETYINPKLHAIEFAKWVSNHQVLDDFWSMSIEAQEEAYEEFLKNP